MLLKFSIISFILLNGIIAHTNPRIYLVRHATVALEKPGWGTSKNSTKYKAAYNVAGVEAFNPEGVLQKVADYEKLDTVFCSPQPRAQETAEILLSGNAVLKIDSTLSELDYQVVQVPVIQLPVKGWLFISRVAWMAGINKGEKSGYRERIDELNTFTDELTAFAHRNGWALVVAHGMVNRELIKILKYRGWEYSEDGNNGFGNLSVNCLEKIHP